MPDITYIHITCARRQRTVFAKLGYECVCYRVPRPTCFTRPSHTSSRESKRHGTDRSLLAILSPEKKLGYRNLHIRGEAMPRPTSYLVRVLHGGRTIEAAIYPFRQ